MALSTRQSAFMVKIQELRFSRRVRRKSTRSKMRVAPICEAQFIAIRIPYCRMKSISPMLVTNVWPSDAHRTSCCVKTSSGCGSVDMLCVCSKTLEKSSNLQVDARESWCSE